jgi:hypothetical protein
MLWLCHWLKLNNSGLSVCNRDKNDANLSTVEIQPMATGFANFELLTPPPQADRRDFLSFQLVVCKGQDRGALVNHAENFIGCLRGVTIRR